MSRDIDDHDHDHYLSVTLPPDIAENFKDFLPEVEGLSYEEVILQQASVYESIQEYGRNMVVASDDDDVSREDPSVSSEDEGEPSRNGSVISQEAMDEALARSLQELGEEFDEFFLTQFSGNANGTVESPIATPSATSSDLSQDDIDPDNMQYEELINLTETVGVENRGLSASHISRLPTSIYTSRMFSKNKEEKCVVCQENFKFGKRLITLPCDHQYHSDCIIEWLKIKKTCPMCQKEVI